LRESIGKIFQVLLIKYKKLYQPFKHYKKGKTATIIN
jgi:hypothetical protein